MSNCENEIACKVRRLLAAREADASICPSDVARSLKADERHWRALMPRVRAVARRMAVDGQLAITQRGATVDPEAPFHGPIRLRRGPHFAVDAQPHCVQLRRSKGWRMPPNTVKVDRTTKWGNPFTVDSHLKAGTEILGGRQPYFAVPTLEDSIECYRQMVSSQEFNDRRKRAISELRGKNLACWCKVGAPCHADILLELVNASVD